MRHTSADLESNDQNIYSESGIFYVVLYLILDRRGHKEKWNPTLVNCWVCIFGLFLKKVTQIKEINNTFSLVASSFGMLAQLQWCVVVQNSYKERQRARRNSAFLGYQLKLELKARSSQSINKLAYTTFISISLNSKL